MENMTLGQIATGLSFLMVFFGGLSYMLKPVKNYQDKQKEVDERIKKIEEHQDNDNKKLNRLEADGYIWCKLEENHWVAYDDSWGKLYLVDTDNFDVILDKFVKIMKDEHHSLIAMKQGLQDIDTIIERLMKL